MFIIIKYHNIIIDWVWFCLSGDLYDVHPVLQADGGGAGQLLLDGRPHGNRGVRQDPGLQQKGKYVNMFFLLMGLLNRCSGDCSFILEHFQALKNLGYRQYTECRRGRFPLGSDHLKKYFTWFVRSLRTLRRLGRRPTQTSWGWGSRSSRRARTTPPSSISQRSSKIRSGVILKRGSKEALLE